MPVLFTGREPDDVTGADLLDWSSVALGPTAAGDDNERLTEWMCVPRGSCARLERYAGALNECRIGCLEKWIDSDSTGEPVRRSFCGGLRACSFDFHTFLSPLFGAIHNSQVILVVSRLLVELAQFTFYVGFVHFLQPVLRFDFFHRYRNRLFTVMQNVHNVLSDCFSETGLLLFRFSRPQLHNYMRHRTFLISMLLFRAA